MWAYLLMARMIETFRREVRIENVKRCEAMIGSVVVSAFLAITVAEVIDIVGVAILLYVAIVWAQRTRAAFVVRGILILSAIYMVARYLDLQMIAWIFQAFFAVFLIMIVVIFQEELRQMFERIALWSLGRQQV
jgi:DNA integrity scanning protein DisA with diadenylate cyclase activity